MCNHRIVPHLAYISWNGVLQRSITYPCITCFCIWYRPQFNVNAPSMGSEFWFYKGRFINSSSLWRRMASCIFASVVSSSPEGIISKLVDWTQKCNIAKYVFSIQTVPNTEAWSTKCVPFAKVFNVISDNAVASWRCTYLWRYASYKIPGNSDPGAARKSWSGAAGHSRGSQLWPQRAADTGVQERNLVVTSKFIAVKFVFQLSIFSVI